MYTGVYNSKVIGRNENKDICLPNKEYTSGH